MLKICAKEFTEHPINSFCATLHLDGVQCLTRLLEEIPDSLSCTQINPLQELIPPSSGVLTPLLLLCLGSGISPSLAVAKMFIFLS